MKTLDGLKWSPTWVSHLGCVKGCLDYLGLVISDAWLYGGTGHAFVINMSADVCASGPTAWRTMMLFELAPNLGYQVDGVFGSKWMEGEFAEVQSRAWEFAKKAIDERLPVYGWELDVPEFYVILGYDDVGYYYSGPEADEGKGPKPWKELGDTEIGLVEVYRVRQVNAQEDPVVVKAALAKVLKHASNPEDWIFEGSSSGVKGFDAWIEALEQERANRFGMGYNTAVWQECREYAAQFLVEAKVRLNGKVSGLLDEGIGHYQTVADRLAKVSEIYPWTLEDRDRVIKSDESSQIAVRLLREAREAEAAGLVVLEKIVAHL